MNRFFVLSPDNSPSKKSYSDSKSNEAERKAEKSPWENVGMSNLHEIDDQSSHSSDIVMLENPNISTAPVAENDILGLCEPISSSRLSSKI